MANVNPVKKLRLTSAVNAAQTLDEAVFVYTTDTKIVYIHDGSTLGGLRVAMYSDLSDYQIELSEGAFVDGDKTKLDGLETGATADMTGAEIKAAYEGEGNTNAYTDADAAKVGHLTVTQAVDLDQMETDIAALANGMVYKGDWDASAGTFPGAGSAQTGWFYYVSVAGTVDGVAFDVGDNIVAVTDNASTSTYASNWSKHDQTDSVQSVAGLTGSITSSGLRSAISVEENADVTDAGNVEDAITGQSADTLTDTSVIPFVKAAALVKITWANFKAAIKSYYDSVTATLTNKTIDGDNNTLSNLDIGNEVDWASANDVADRAAFASGDKLLIYEAGVGFRKIDYDDLPSGGSGGGLFASYAVICDQKTQGTNGGTFTSGADRTRDLNTEIFDPDGIVSISSNRFTLAAGTYLIKWSAPAMRVGGHQSFLYNYSDTSEIQRGTTGITTSSSYKVATSTTGYARVTITANKSFEIRHRGTTSRTSDGFGVAANFGVEIYTVVEIYKES